jgi:hypothetical protein
LCLLIQKNNVQGSTIKIIHFIQLKFFVSEDNNYVFPD